MKGDFILECTSLVKHYPTITPINYIDLTLKHNELLSILGPSGCGKSTLLSVIAGLESIHEGRVWINGKIATTPETMMPPEKRRVGMVFQDIALFPHLNVYENIRFGIKAPRKDQNRRVLEMLELVSMQGTEKKMPHQLSGGEQQRVAVARALAPSPQILLLDEPFSSLDYKLRVQLRQDIRAILREAQVSAILVTHDQTEAYNFADRMMILCQGKVMQEGSPPEIYQQPATLWVASFVGDANIFPLQAVQEDLGENSLWNQHPWSLATKIMIRPEELLVKKVRQKEAIPHGFVKFIEFYGDHQMLHIELKSGICFRASFPGRVAWQVGDIVKITPQYVGIYDEEQVAFFSLS